MKYLLMLILLIGTLPSALQAGEESHFLLVKLEDDKLSLGPMGLTYRGPAEIAFWSIGWYERFENAKDGKYFVFDDRGRIGERSKIDTSSYPNGVLSYAIGTDGVGLQKTEFKLPSVSKFPTDKERETDAPPFIKCDYKTVYESLSMAEYYRVPSKQIDLLAFKDEKLKEVIVGVVNKKSAILIVRFESSVWYFLRV